MLIKDPHILIHTKMVISRKRPKYMPKKKHIIRTSKI